MKAVTLILSRRLIPTSSKRSFALLVQPVPQLMKGVQWKSNLPKYFSSSALTESLAKEIEHEMNEVSNDVDQEFVDAKKKVTKLFKVEDVPGLGEKSTTSILTLFIIYYFYFILFFARI
jgi:hypothetical protein